MKPMLKGSSKGFTLIEMLIVIAVISILAGIVLVGITGFQSSARDTKRVGDLRSIQNNLELYFTRCGHYPTSGTCGNPSTTGLEWDALETELVAQGIISADRLANDPQNNPSNSASPTYEYGVSSDGSSYTMKAILENNSSALAPGSGDIDGTSNGLTCQDSSTDFFYCVGSE